MVDRVGQVLGGRYRLVAPIGTGASASVYLADDVTLRRRVAVKILHDAIKKGMDDPAHLKVLDELDQEYIYKGSDEYKEFALKTIQEQKELIEKLGLKGS